MSTDSSPTSGGNHSAGEAGTGVIASVTGVFVFLVLLLFAVQITYDLFATSAVSAAAYDAARVVAGADAQGRSEARAAAEAEARRVLGRYGDRVSFTWRIDADVVELRVVAVNPGFLPAAVRQPLGADVVDRTVRMRVERVR
jgi:hypothetical protein